jgi:thiamine-phosphate pyrophosphorylase
LILYYITDRLQFAGDERNRRLALLGKIEEASRNDVDFIQLREKDLSAKDLEILVRAAVMIVRENSKVTRLLINSRSDVAIACGASGVHLRSNDISPREVREIWREPKPIISISCHSVVDVRRAAEEGADFAVFAPVFEKKGSEASPAGLEMLRAACQSTIPVLALGGVTMENAEGCKKTGAAGIAGIRIFQENEIRRVGEALKGR